MLEPPHPSSYRSWPAAFAVFAAITAHVGGLVVWDSHTPGVRELPGGQPVVVGHGARLMPAAGWQMDVSGTRTGTSLALVKDGTSFSVNTGPWMGGPQGPMARQTRLLERAGGMHLEGEPEPYTNTWGSRGQTAAYYGPNTAGRFWQIVDVSRKSVVTVDFRGAPSAVAANLPQAKAMVDSMDLGAP